MAASKAADAGGPPRSRRNRERELIQVAIELFWEKGYSAASVQEVADRVGVLKGSLYYYIDSKEDLLFRIFQESHEQASEFVVHAEALDAPPLEKLRAYFERYVLWYLENVERVSLYFSELRHLTGERRETVLEQRNVYEKFVRGQIEAAKKDGSIKATTDVRYATFFVLGAVNAVPSWYRRNGRDSAEEIASVYTDLIVATLT